MWLVDLFECMMMHGLTNPKMTIEVTEQFLTVKCKQESFPLNAMQEQVISLTMLEGHIKTETQKKLS
jgi:hypothetical protein